MAEAAQPDEPSAISEPQADPVSSPTLTTSTYQTSSPPSVTTEEPCAGRSSCGRPTCKTGITALNLLREELGPDRGAPPRRDVVRALCLRMGMIPPDLRSKVWPVLLLPEPHANTQLAHIALEQRIRHVRLDLANQGVIEVDVERTRTELPVFKDESIRVLIARILTYYCKDHQTDYKQGLNEVLAPFLVIHDGSPDPGRTPEAAKQVEASCATAYLCFEAFIDRFLRNMYLDKEFRALQCIFHLFRLVLLYHNPVLCQRLDQYFLPPELYLPGWVITVCSRTVDIQTLFHLWDIYLLEDEPMLHFFFILAFINSKEDLILGASEATLPETVSRLTFQGRLEVKALINEAKRLKAQTPDSFCSALERLYSDSMSVASLEDELEMRASLSCLTVGGAEVLSGIQRQLRAFDLTPDSDADVDDSVIPEERSGEVEGEAEKKPPAVSSCVEVSYEPEEAMWDREYMGSPVAKTLNMAGQLRYFILDCRPQEDFVKYQLATSMHLDPKLLDSGEEGDQIVEQLKAMRGSHFCLLGSNGDGALRDHQQQPVARFIKLFLNHGFCHISVVKGGMPECERLINEKFKHRRSGSLGGLMVMSRGGGDDTLQEQKGGLLRRWFQVRGGLHNNLPGKTKTPSPDRPRKTRPSSFSSELQARQNYPRRRSKGRTTKSEGSSMRDRLSDFREARRLSEEGRMSLSSDEGSESDTDWNDDKSSMVSDESHLVSSPSGGDADDKARRRTFMPLFWNRPRGESLRSSSEGALQTTTTDPAQTISHSAALAESHAKSQSAGALPNHEPTKAEQPRASSSGWWFTNTLGRGSNESTDSQHGPSTASQDAAPPPPPPGKEDGTGVAPPPAPSGSKASPLSPTAAGTASVGSGGGNLLTNLVQRLRGGTPLTSPANNDEWKENADGSLSGPSIVRLSEWNQDSNPPTRFPVRYQDPHTHRLVECSLYLSSDRVLQAIDIPHHPGMVRRISEHDLRHLLMVTRKKKEHNHLKLHFEPDGTTASSPSDNTTTTNNRPRNLSSSSGSNPNAEYMEVFSTDTERIVSQLESRVRSFRQPQSMPPSPTPSPRPPNS